MVRDNQVTNLNSVLAMWSVLLKTLASCYILYKLKLLRKACGPALQEKSLIESSLILCLDISR